MFLIVLNHGYVISISLGLAGEGMSYQARRNPLMLWDCGKVLRAEALSRKCRAGSQNCRST